MGDDGQPSTYAPGHGDLPDALRRSGLLDAFIARGGKYVWIANLDNLGATIGERGPPRLVHRRAARTVQVEVAPTRAEGGPVGGIPVWADSSDASGRVVRRLQVLEEFRLPQGFDASAVRVFNTNTFLVRAEALLHTNVVYAWFEVEKKVGARVAVQFERLLQELTAAMSSTYVRVPREAAALPGFLPVKELRRAREAPLRTSPRFIATERGMIATGRRESQHEAREASGHEQVDPEPPGVP